ncbi:MAG: hypothetical protein E7K72_22785 [Roseomonas mucosa]|nr:hypothetical protein [Roseomonas mucosa]
MADQPSPQRHRPPRADRHWKPNAAAFVAQLAAAPELSRHDPLLRFIDIRIDTRDGAFTLDHRPGRTGLQSVLRALEAVRANRPKPPRRRSQRERLTWTPEMLEALKQLMRLDATLGECARRIGVSLPVVVAQARKMNPDYRRKTPAP